MIFKIFEVLIFFLVFFVFFKDFLVFFLKGFLKFLRQFLNIRHKDFQTLSVMLSGYPSWILKWAGLESSGQRLLSSRATRPVLTSDKEEKHTIFPASLNFAVRRGKLVIYTPNPHLRYSKSLLFLEECAVVCFA